MTEAQAPYSVAELMAVEMARNLTDDDVCCMGAVSMAPMVACRLAQLTHAPNLSFMVGGSGSFDPYLAPLPASSCDYDLLRAASSPLPLPEVILMEGRGAFSVFFAGGLQIDAYGNCNLVCIGDWAKPKLKGPGTVGLPFLPRAGRVVIYTMSHNARTLVEKVDFVSGPGFLSGPDEWKAQNLPGGGPSLVVTPLATLDFDPDTLRMRLRSVHPGVSVDQVRENTGFELVVPATVAETQPPSAAELALMRSVDSSGLLQAMG